MPHHDASVVAFGVIATVGPGREDGDAYVIKRRVQYTRCSLPRNVHLRARLDDEGLTTEAEVRTWTDW